LKNVGVTAVIQKANQLRKGIQRKEKKKKKSVNVVRDGDQS
jgi:hypothetical protein